MSIDIISKIQTGTPPDTNATQLFLMDVEKLLDALPQQPLFDLVVTSPPYNIGKEYETQKPLTDYVAWQRRIIEKIYPRLKDNGSICWQVGNYVENGSITPLDIELAPIFKDLNLHLRNRIIWHFGHGLHNKNRFSGRYEVVMWYTKQTHIPLTLMMFVYLQNILASEVIEAKIRGNCRETQRGKIQKMCGKFQM